MIVQPEDLSSQNRVSKRMTEPLGLRQHIRFGDEIASKVDLIDENKEAAA